LAACVLWATITAQDVQTVNDQPAGITGDRAQYLRRVADHVVDQETKE